MTTSPEKRAHIRSLYRDGMSNRKIAQHLNMPCATIRRIVEGIQSPNPDVIKAQANRMKPKA